MKLSDWIDTRYLFALGHGSGGYSMKAHLIDPTDPYNRHALCGVYCTSPFEPSGEIDYNVCPACVRKASR